jgi:hypothetical protein
MERLKRATAKARGSKPEKWTRKTWKWIFAATAAGAATIIAGVVVATPGWIREKVDPQSKITFTAQRERLSCTPYVIPKRINEVSDPPTDNSETGWSDWALRLGGAEMDRTKVLVTLRGRGTQSVTVTGLTFSVSERGRPLSGSLVDPACGDETVARYAEVDLDQDPPRIVASSSVETSWGGEEWRATPLKFPYVVSSSQSESLLIIARTKQYRAWTAALSWTDGEKTGKDIIDFGGKPFKTSAATNTESYSWNYSDGRWEKW